MHPSILALTDKGTTVVSAHLALKKDLLPWIGAGAVGVLLNIALGFFIVFATHTEFSPDTFHLATATLYLATAPRLGLVLVSVILATRQIKNAFTIMLALVLFIGFSLPRGFNYTTTLLPNSILSAVVVMVGLLAASRLVTYFFARKSVNISLSPGAWLIYGTTIIASFILTSTTLYEFLY